MCDTSEKLDPDPIKMSDFGSATLVYIGLGGWGLLAATARDCSLMITLQLWGQGGPGGALPGKEGGQHQGVHCFITVLSSKS